MIEPRPAYLLSPPGGDSRFSALAPGLEVVTLTEAGALKGRTPGLLFLPIEILPADQVLTALAILGAAPSQDPWMPVFVQEAADGKSRLIPVSLGWPTPLSDLSQWVGGADGAEVLELRHVVSMLSRARHDLNNFLTAALAETQLALMDVLDPGLREGLESVEEQLRRIRDLVKEMRAFRPPGNSQTAKQ